MKNKILTIIFSAILGLQLLTIKLQAVTYTSTDCTVNSGESITITVKASENMQNYDLALTSYNGLTFVGCSANENAAVNSATGAISFATLGSGVTTLGTYTFKAPEVTSDTNYNVIFNINGVSNTAKVTVKAKETIPPSSSSNNSSEQKSKLTAVTVDGTTYNNGDKIVVENDKTTVRILGVGESLYYIKVNGESSGIDVKLNEGTNSIVVYDNNGGEIKLSISRKAKEEETKPNVIEKVEEDENEEKVEEELALNALEVVGLELEPKFSPNIYSYTINIDMESKDYSKLEVKATSNQEDAIIKIDGAEELVQGENVINIIVTSKDGSEIKTYQIIVNKIALSGEITDDTEKVESTNQENINKNKILIIVGCVGVLIVIVLTIIAVKKTRLKEEEETGNLYNYDLHIDKNNDVKNQDIDKIDNKENETEKTDVEEKSKKDKKKRKGKGKHA